MSKPAIRSADARQAGALQDDGDGSLLKQPRRRLAGRDGLQKAHRPPRDVAPGPRRSPTGAVRVRSADCPEGPALASGWSRLPSRFAAQSRMAIGADASASTSGDRAEVRLGINDRQGTHGVHSRLIGEVPALDHLLQFRLACRGTGSRGRRRHPARRRPAASIRSSSAASRAASRRDGSSSASPRSWAPCWTAFKSLSRSAGCRFSETASATSVRHRGGNTVAGDVVEDSDSTAPAVHRTP